MNTIETIVVQNIQKNEQNQPYFIVELFLEKDKRATVTFFLYFYERKEENGWTSKHYMLQETIEALHKDELDKARLIAQLYKRLQKDEKRRNRMETQKKIMKRYAERMITSTNQI